jgi:hypothetical protein
MSRVEHPFSARCEEIGHTVEISNNYCQYNASQNGDVEMGIIREDADGFQTKLIISNIRISCVFQEAKRD